MRARYQTLAAERTGWLVPGRATANTQPTIVVGLVNNMSDAGLRAAERHVCTLLAAASRDFVVRLKLFSFPHIERSGPAREHIDRYYEDIAELERDPPDGLIVTGAEPRSPGIVGEPHWPALSRLADLVRDASMPAIWSCLAAHAAVMRWDGIERVALGPKLSGVYECSIDSAAHEIMRGTPDRWRVPHSRFFGLPDEALVARGHRIVSWSPEGGADI
ncbi:MAG: homoserine O-succinyltransferase, partial [Acetobacteraceae bacterium]|nr:homoserine O-succinyltransferase [Acetobacteraceae bacterium]